MPVSRLLNDVMTRTQFPGVIVWVICERDVQKSSLYATLFWQGNPGSNEP